MEGKVTPPFLVVTILQKPTHVDMSRIPSPVVTGRPWEDTVITQPLVSTPGLPISCTTIKEDKA